MDRRPVGAWVEGALAIAKEAVKLILKRPVVGIVAVALDGDRRVVLMRRRDTGTWCLPGGSVDWGETLERALARELREETGYRLLRITPAIGGYSGPGPAPAI